jgi:hypothetical protein
MFRLVQHERYVFDSAQGELTPAALPSVVELLAESICAGRPELFRWYLKRLFAIAE